MARRTRIANKTQWALQDIVGAVARAKRECMALSNRNEQKFMDPIIAMRLQRLIDAISAIEVTAIRAQHGEYLQERLDLEREGE